MTKKFITVFTQKGYEKVIHEYEELKAKRPSLVDELTRARDMGDRSENAAYKSARRNLSGADSRLRFLKRLIDSAKISKATQADFVEVGTRVTVHNGSQDIVFEIVGEHEADPMNKKISFKSPVGQALLRKKIGETAVISVPSGRVEYKIATIEII